MLHMQHAACGAPLEAEDRDRLRELAARVGETRAAERLRVSRQTFARALAGLGVHRGTAALIVQGLRAEPPQEPKP